MQMLVVLRSKLRGFKRSSPGQEARWSKIVAFRCDAIDHRVALTGQLPATIALPSRLRQSEACTDDFH